MTYLYFHLLVIHIYVLQILLTLISICRDGEDHFQIIIHKFLNRILISLLHMDFISIFVLHIYGQSL
jgi:hypothetical protein